MTTLVPVAVSPLRQRLIDEMDIRRFGHETQRNYMAAGPNDVAAKAFEGESSLDIVRTGHQ